MAKKILMLVILFFIPSKMLHSRIIEEDIFSKGSDVYIAKEDTLKGDIKSVGGDIEILGRVEGDVNSVGADVVVKGIVTGSVKTMGGDLYVDGKIEGDATTMGGNITGSGEIRGKVEAKGGDIDIELREDIKEMKNELFDMLKELRISLGGIKVVDINISGLVNIPQNVVSDTFGIKIGDETELENLARGVKNIEALEYFSDVGVELKLKGNGFLIEIGLKENPYIEQLYITGNTLFSTEELLEKLEVNPGEVLKGSIKTKTDLLNSLYYEDGYELAEVSPDYDAELHILTFNIDEGRIDRIEIEGNKRVPTSKILETLNIREGEIYNVKKIKEVLAKLEEKFPLEAGVKTKKKRNKITVGIRVEMADEEKPEFIVREEEKQVEGKPPEVTKEKGENVLKIYIDEKGPIKHDSNFRYNRVEGAYLGLTLTSRSFMPNDLIGRLSGGYGFAGKIWEYKLGLEKPFFSPHTLSFGGEYYKIVDTFDRELLSEGEQTAASLLLRCAYYDYYIREGYSLFVSQHITASQKLKLEYRDDEYSSIPKSTNWSIFKGNPFRENPPVDEGRMKSILLSYTYDTRKGSDFASGWFASGCAEFAGDKMGDYDLAGDFDFSRYTVDLRRYNKLSHGQYLDFRIMGGSSPDCLPVQKRFYLGDISTLHGYNYKEFLGNLFALSNVEYRIGEKWQGVFCWDIGGCWETVDDFDTDDLKSSIGLGIAGNHGSAFRLTVAKRLDREDAPVKVYLRFQRSF